MDYNHKEGKIFKHLLAYLYFGALEKVATSNAPNQMSLEAIYGVSKPLLSFIISKITINNLSLIAKLASIF